jgi:hypothetical protein
MSKSRYYEEFETKQKPRTLKRQKQREAMQQYRPVFFPQPDPPAWKPLG